MADLTPFGSMFVALIRSRGMAQRDLGPSATITNYVRGHRAPPPERWDEWADQLRLVGDERERFLNLAAIAHLPRPVQDRFVALLDSRERAARTVAAVEHYLNERDALRAEMEREKARADHLQQLVHQYSAVIERAQQIQAAEPRAPYDGGDSND